MRRPWLAAILVLIFLASSVAALGPWGIAVAGYLLAIVSVICLWRRGWKDTSMVLLASLVALGLFVLLLPVSFYVGEAGARSQCANNLRQIALALLNYADHHGCFPPAYLCDASGKPMHSWRVLLLPYLEAGDLYKTYNFNEPWNGPTNRLLESSIPPPYVCPSAFRDGANQPPMTSYVVVTGVNTAFPGCQSRRLKDISDDKHTTVLLVEVANSDIHWMAPRDPSLDDLMSAGGGGCHPLTSHHTVASDYWHDAEPGSGSVADADARVHFLRGPISPEDARVLLTANDGQGLDIEKFAKQMPLVGRPRWDHVIGLPLFFLSFVALLVMALTACPSPKGTGDFRPTPRREDRPAAEPLTPR